jgi:hypothetical protein
MPIADHVDGDNSLQSIANRYTPDRSQQVCDPRLEAIVGHDRRDDGLVHNHDWALRDNIMSQPNRR